MDPQIPGTGFKPRIQQDMHNPRITLKAASIPRVGSEPSGSRDMNFSEQRANSSGTTIEL